MDKWLGRAVTAALVASAAVAPETGWAVTLRGPQQELAASAGEDNGVAARLRRAEAAEAEWTPALQAILDIEVLDEVPAQAPEELPRWPVPEERSRPDEWERMVRVAMGGSAPQPEFDSLELGPLLLHYGDGEGGAMADLSEGLAREEAAARRQAEKDRAMGGQENESGTREETLVRRLPLWLVVPVVAAGLLVLAAIRALRRQDAMAVPDEKR